MEDDAVGTEQRHGVAGVLEAGVEAALGGVERHLGPFDAALGHVIGGAAVHAGVELEQAAAQLEVADDVAGELHQHAAGGGAEVARHLSNTHTVPRMWPSRAISGAPA